jgi:predicted enzyme related to lactoylglutathione lyase
VINLSFRGVVLDAPDVAELGSFYERLLRWPTTSKEPEWWRFEPDTGGTGLAIQLEPNFVRPSWPSDTTHQQMQLHLDFKVDDLAAATEHALRAGATLADFQPQDDVRVLLDPVGHPFCLFEQ